MPRAVAVGDPAEGERRVTGGHLVEDELPVLPELPQVLRVEADVVVRVVDLVRDARDERAQGGQFCGLEELLLVLPLALRGAPALRDVAGNADDAVNAPAGILHGDQDGGEVPAIVVEVEGPLQRDGDAGLDARAVVGDERLDDPGRAGTPP